MEELLKTFKELHDAGISPFLLNLLAIIIIFWIWDFKIRPILDRVYHTKLLKDRSTSDSSVIDVLHQYMDLILCDRISIYEFHNTTYNIYGKSFLNYTCTYEVSRLGVLGYNIKNKNLPISGIKELLGLITNHKIIKIDSITDNKKLTPELVNFLSQGGFKSGLIVPIIFKGVISGFMLVEFTRAENYANENKNDIELNSSVLVGEIASRVCKGNK